MAWIAIVLFTTGCVGTSTPAPAQSQPRPPVATKQIVAAVMGDPVTLSQKLNAAGAGSIPGADALEQLVNAGLVILDASGTLRPQLAEAVPTVENGLWTVAPDGSMATTWRIRPGTQWHDGVAFTSADLLFTALIGQDREMAAFRDIVYDAIASIEAPSPQTIVVRWKRPFIAADTLFTNLRALPLPRHLLEPPYQATKETFTELPYWSQDFVGTGPFRLRQWVRGSHMLADANERYVLGRPKIDSLEIRFIPDANALVASVLAGGVELTLGRNLSLETAIDTRDRWPTGRMEVGLKSWIALFPQFLNPSPTALADLRFRRALLHAIDRQQLADTLQAGLTPVAHTLFAPGQAERTAVEAGIVRYDHDPRRASQLLAEVGPIPRAPVEIRTIAGDDIIEKATFAVADDWRRLGLATEPFPIPIQRVRDREWRATFPGFELLRQPNDAAAVTRAHSSETPLPDNTFTGTNRSRYRNADLDGLLDRYVSTIPEGPRMQLLGEIIHHMTDELVWMGLFYNAEATMVALRIQNAAANNTTGTTQAWNAHEWDVR